MKNNIFPSIKLLQRSLAREGNLEQICYKWQKVALPFNEDRYYGRLLHRIYTRVPLVACIRPSIQNNS